jgi:peptidase inhibitor family I36
MSYWDMRTTYHCRFFTSRSPGDDAMYGYEPGFPSATASERMTMFRSDESATRRMPFRRLACAMAALAFGLVAAVLAPAPAGAAPASAQQLRAWECPAGNVCVWTGAYGTGSRCLWSDADNDWQNGGIRCSWSASQPVRSIYNNGTSSSYAGVALYQAANYQSFYWCVPQGVLRSDENVYLRSHRWVGSATGCVA